MTSSRLAERSKLEISSCKMDQPIDKEIIREFPWAREIQCYTLLVCPLIQRQGNKFTAIVHLNPFWRPAQGAHMPYRRNDILGFQREIYRDIAIHYSFFR